MKSETTTDVETNVDRNIVAAIDIGTTKIVAIVGEKLSDGKLKILGMGSSPSTGVKRGVVQNIQKTVQSISTAVGIAEEQSGLKLKEAFVGIAGQHIRSTEQSHQFPRTDFEAEITHVDIDKLKEVMYSMPVEPGEEIIHVVPKSFIVDDEFGVEPLGMCGKLLVGTFHIVIGQVTSANNIKRCIERVNITTKDLILEPLASANAVLTDEEKEVGVALVDIGGGTTDIAVYKDNRIVHTAVIPFGGDVITKDIKEAYNIVERSAEKLKILKGSALTDIIKPNEYVSIEGINGRPAKEISVRNLAYIINCRIDEIIDRLFLEITRHIDTDKLGAGIVLTGGGALLKNLKQFIAFKTGLDIRIGSPNKLLISDLDDDLNKTKYATAIGLLIGGFELMNETEKRTTFEEFVLNKEEEVIAEKKEEEEPIKEEVIDNRPKISIGAKLKNTFISVFTEENEDKELN